MSGNHTKVIETIPAASNTARVMLRKSFSIEEMASETKNTLATAREILRFGISQGFYEAAGSGRYHLVPKETDIRSSLIQAISNHMSASEKYGFMSSAGIHDIGKVKTLCHLDGFKGCRSEKGGNPNAKAKARDEIEWNNGVEPKNPENSGGCFGDETKPSDETD